MPVRVLFGRQPGSAVDDRFLEEAEVVERLGASVLTTTMDRIVEEDWSAVFADGDPDGEELLYRGWMLSAAEYEALASAAEDAGHLLVVDSGAYERVHYVSEYLDAVSDLMPPTAFTLGADADEAWGLAQELGAGPWLIKDHVKSAKEHWEEACFVGAGASKDEFIAVCRRLQDVRGPAFERGFVVRRPVELRKLPFAGQMPIYNEHRIFFWEGQPVACAPYHDVDIPPIDTRDWTHLGRRIESPFFTADVAERADGTGWSLIELGAGSVSLLPPQMSPVELYEAILGDEAERA